MAMSSQPLITTVIPTYRRPHMLRRAIRSVLDQTYFHFKICVYDNASNDETAEIVNELALRDSRVRYHCHTENIGSQDNFIYGLSRVDTPLFSLLSDDDFLLPDFFAQATTALRNHPDAGFFFGGVLPADPTGHVIGLPRFGSEPEQTYTPLRLFHILALNSRTWTSILFRRTLLESLGGLKKATSFAADTDFILRSAIRYRAVLSDTPCAVFTVHPASTSVAHFPETFEALLNLALYDSITEAIDSAQNDAIVTTRDAAEMKAIYRAATERLFFHCAFGLIARGRLSLAVRTSDILAEVFNRKDMATIIRLASLENSIGALLRLTIRSIKAARKLWFAGNSTARYSAYSELVKHRILQLTTRTSENSAC